MGFLSRSNDKLKIEEVETKPCAITLSVEVPMGMVNEETESSYKDIQAQAKMPGFRAGKVPMELVKKNFESSARERALERLVHRSVDETLKSRSIEPVSTPEISELKYDIGKPLTYKIRIEYAPKFKLGSYKGLKIESKNDPVTDDDIEKYMDRLREINAKLAEAKDEIVKKEHLAVIDYEGKIDGHSIEGAKASGQLVDMSSVQMISGLTEGILGMKIGETKEIKVKFPDDHPRKEWAGKDAVFSVTLKHIQEKKMPELNDDFAKDVGCKDITELKAKINESLGHEKEKKRKQDIEMQIIDRLLSNNDFQVPETLVSERLNYLLEGMKKRFISQGAGEEEWKKHEPDMRTRTKLEAEKQVRLSYILSAIINSEQINVSNEEVERRIEESLNTLQPDQRGKAKKNLVKNKESIRAQMKEEKLFSFLIDNAKIKEKH